MKGDRCAIKYNYYYWAYYGNIIWNTYYYCTSSLYFKYNM